VKKLLIIENDIDRLNRNYILEDDGFVVVKSKLRSCPRNHRNRSDAIVIDYLLAAAMAATVLEIKENPLTKQILLFYFLQATT